MQKDLPRTSSNPLDSVEDLLISNDWMYKRMTSEELLMTVSGKTCEYNFSFNWNYKTSRLTFSCIINTEISDEKLGEAILFANELNRALGFGHFVVDHEIGRLVHKYNLLCDDDADLVDRSYLAQVVECILKECEENAAVLSYFLNKEICTDKKLLSLLISPAEGHA